MNKYVCLRDDDTCYHTRLSELEAAYGEFWGKIPITLAVVPFVHGSWEITNEMEAPKFRNLREWQLKATVQQLNDFHKLKPLGENVELVNGLKPLVSSKMIEIAQHGVSHRYNENGPEMYSNKTGYEIIRDGKEYMEKLFDTKISFFVPPSNTIDVKCVSYVRELGMNLFSSGTIVKDASNKPAFDYNNAKNYLRRRLFGKTIPMTKHHGIMQFGSYTYTAGMDYDHIYSVIKNDLNDSGFAGLGTHYMCFSEGGYFESYHKLLHELIEKEGVEFVSATDYFNLINKKYYE